MTREASCCILHRFAIQPVCCLVASIGAEGSFADNKEGIGDVFLLERSMNGSELFYAPAVAAFFKLLCKMYVKFAAAITSYLEFSS